MLPLNVRRYLAGVLLLICWLVSGTWLESKLYGHVPVPDSILNPQSAPEAWNVLRLASANIDRLLSEERFAEVPDQASLCQPSLRLIARLAQSTSRRQETAIATIQVGSAIGSLVQACVVNDRASAKMAAAKLHVALEALDAGEDAKTVGADIFSCPMHPEVLSEVSGSSCPKCGMPLLPRRIPYSFVYAAPPGEPSMAMTVAADGPPIAGRKLQVTVRLTRKDGVPVTDGDLLVAHTQRIHLLIIDPTLEDYHHEHPTPTGEPGEYRFTFVPQRSSAYRIFADVVPSATGIQEYIPATLLGAQPVQNIGQQSIQRQSCLEANVGNLHFRLRVGEVPGAILHAGMAEVLHITVSDDKGQPVRQLEPVMNAFAHLVGFYEDGLSVVHLHPAGMDVEDATVQGGPDLDFRFYPAKAGFLRLYCQVSVGGKTVYAPFGLNVLPREHQ